MKPWIPEQVLGGGDIAGHSRLAVWNAFVSLIQQPVSLGGGATLALEQASKPNADDRLAKIETAMPAGAVFCRLMDFPFAQLTGSELTTGDVDVLPDPLAEAIFQGVLSVVTALVPANWGMELRLAGLSRGASVETASEWFDAMISKPGMAPIALKVGGNRDWLLAALAEHIMPGPTGAGPLAGTLTVPADVTIGRLALTRRELSAIEPGDVVVMAATAAGSVSVRIGERTFTFFPSQDQYVCGGSTSLEAPRPASFRSEITAMSEMNTEDRPAENEHPGGLADLVLAVDFDIGRIEIPMATVAGWTPGTVIQMQQPALDSGVPVTLRVNGQAIGTGDIVRIDDRIGVRITRLTA